MPSRSKKKQIAKNINLKEKEALIKSLQPNDAEMLLDELPEDTKVQMIERISYEQMLYSGPIPPAEEMAKYNQVIPNGGDRIMAMAEKQSEHRQSLEKSVVKSKNRDSLLGVIFAGAIGITGLILGYFLITNGHKITGTLFAGTPLATLVGLYLRGTNLDKEDLQQKSIND